MSFAAALSKYQLADVFRDWCELKQIVNVDTAFCNKTERNLVLQSFHFLADFKSDDNMCNVFYYTWLWIRRLALTSVRLNDFGVAVCPYIVTSKITSLSFENCNEKLFHHKVINLINSCNKLTNLSFLNANSLASEDYSKINSIILTNLEQFKLIALKDSKFQYDTIKHIANNCTSLTSLHLVSSCQVVMAEKDIRRLLEKNKKLVDLVLQQVYYNFQNNIPDFLPTICPQLERVIFRGRCKGKTEGFLSILKGCNNLQHIKFFDTNDQHYLFEYNKCENSVILHYAHKSREKWTPLFDHLENLMSIELKFLSEIDHQTNDVLTDTYIRKLIDKHFKTLQTLKFLGNKSITDDTLKYGLHKCKKLTYLGVPRDFFDPTNNHQFCKLLKKTSHSLTSLELSHCETFNQSILNKILRQNKSIKHLKYCDFEGENALEEDSFNAFLKHHYPDVVVEMVYDSWNGLRFFDGDDDE